MKISYRLFCFFMVMALAAGCQKTQLTNKIDKSLNLAVMQYKTLYNAAPDSLLPLTTASSTSDSLVTTEPWVWTSGFFPGGLWYLYEYSGSEEIKEMAVNRTWAIEGQKHNANDHDIGFKIFCSFGNAFRITNDSSYAKVIMTAAETLTKRYDKDVKAIRSWGDRNNQEGRYQVIVDNMMNLELLFWATKFSGDSTYATIAVNHADKTLEHHYREDGSSYHVVDFDSKTGEVLGKRTVQGYSDSSAWARGQSWGLYGFTMAYRETAHERYLDQAREIAHFLLNHPRLPEDSIPYWDYDAPLQNSGEDIQRDASAASIMASALLELSTHVEGEESQFYLENAKKIVGSLSEHPYRTQMGEKANFLLKHSVGSMPANSEVDVPEIYADYYYLEAMLQYKKTNSLSAYNFGFVAN